MKAGVFRTAGLVYTYKYVDKDLFFGLAPASQNHDTLENGHVLATLAKSATICLKTFLTEEFDYAVTTSEFRSHSLVHSK